MPKAGAYRALALLFFLVLPRAVAAEELYETVFVSMGGADSSTCGASPGAACKTLEGAIKTVITGGVLHVFAGNYQRFVINKSVEVIADGPVEIVGQDGLPCGTAYAVICISGPPSTIVRLRGIAINVIEHSSFSGIRFVSGAALHLEESRISHIAQFALQFAPTSGASELYISESVISDNSINAGAGGILIRPTGSASVKARLKHVIVDNNRVGISLEGPATTGAIFVAIEDSSISGNTTNGLQAYDPGGALVNVSIEDSRIANNGDRGLSSNGAASVVSVGNSVISGNGVGVIAVGGGQMVSTGGNAIVGNTTNGVFTGTVPRR